MRKISKRLITILISIIILLVILFILLLTNTINFKSQNTISNNYDEQIKEKNRNNDSDNEGKVCIEDNHNEKYIYKAIVTNKNGAKVYSDYVNEIEVTTIEYGKEIEIFGDWFNPFNDEHKDTYQRFEEIKDYYYLSFFMCGERVFIKYTDVSIITSSISIQYKLDKKDELDKKVKVYLANDEYLYSGPGLSFETNEDSKKVPKGTILEYEDVWSTYRTNVFWVYIDSNGYSGWLLVHSQMVELYPYGNKFSNVFILNENPGEITLEEDNILLKEEDNILSDYLLEKDFLKIPSGTKLNYDYYFNEFESTMYYHVSYNGDIGWIRIAY